MARGLCKNHYAQQRYREKREAAGFVVRPRKPIPQDIVGTPASLPASESESPAAEAPEPSESQE